MIARYARMCWGDKCPPHCPRPPTAAAGSNFTGSQSRFHPAGAGFHSAHAGRISRSEPRRRARRYRVAGRWSCVSSGTPGNPPKIIRTPCKRGGIMHCFNLLRRFMPPLRGSCYLIYFRGLRSPCCRFASLHPRLLYVAHGRGLMDSSVVND